MTCHARRESFVPKIAIFLQFQVKQIINLLLLNNFYPMVSYDIDEFKRIATNYSIYSSVTRYGPQSVASAT